MEIGYLQRKIKNITRAVYGKTYKTVEIGGKRWMAENLDYEIEESWCYDDNPFNCAQYGRLYDWYMAMTVCPVGWHLSTHQEWRDLLAATGSDSADDSRLRSTTGWKNVVEHCKYGKCPDWSPGTDDYGFSALFGGYRAPNGKFYNAGEYGYWWEAPSGNCDSVNVSIQIFKSYNGDTAEDRDYSSNDRYSVRCVQNDDGGGGSKCNPLNVACPTDYAEERRKRLSKKVEKLSEYFTDSRDGKRYRTVKMGNMTWMAENLDYAPKSGNSWCIYNNVCYCGEYGRLYDWKTAKTACPSGWHLPSRDDWDSLAYAVGGKKFIRDNGTISWEDVTTNMKSEHGWDPRFSVDWTDQYGFSALPNGHRDSKGDFSPIYGDGRGQWWTTAESDSGKIVTRAVGYYGDNMDEYIVGKNEGWPVRCVRDARRFDE